MAPSPNCHMCGQKNALACSKCKTKYYCGTKCQAFDWESHKHFCKKSSKVSPYTEHVDDPLGPYQEGSTFYDSAVGIRIRWLSKKERREYSLKVSPWDSDEKAWESIRESNDWEVVPEWRVNYSSREEMVEDAHESFDPDDATYEEDVKSFIQEQDEENVAYKHSCVWSVKDYCVHYYGAKSPEEVVWDYVGVPRLLAIDKDAEKKLKRAGWVDQGYKPGRCFELCDQSVECGRRLVCVDGIFWEEPHKDVLR